MQLTEIQHIAHLGSWEWDVLANTVSWSEELYRIFGLQPMEFDSTLEAYLASVHPDDRGLVESTIQESLRNKVFRAFEHRVLRPDGTIVAVQAAGKVVVDATGRVIKMLGTAQDITERRQIEEKQKESNEWLNLVLTTSRDGIMVEDKGKVVYTNKSYSEMVGYDTAEEMFGIDIAELLPPDEVERMTEYSAARLRGDSPPSIYEFMTKRKDGSLLRVEASVSTSIVAGKTYISTAIRDISERKRAEAALQEADRRAITEYERLLNRLALLAQSLGSARDLTTVYRALSEFTLASAPCKGIVIAIYYPQRQVREAVYVWAEGAEVSPSELPPLPVGDGPIGRAIRTGEIFVCEDLGKEMLNRPVLWLGSEDLVVTRPALIAPMVIMGRVIGVLEIQNDDGDTYKVEHVTALRLAANLAASAIENVRLLEQERTKEQRSQQAQKMESIGTLAGGIAHDFNNVLAAILGYSELAAADLPSDHQAQSHLGQVLKAAGRAKESVKQILAFSRQQEPDRKLISIGPILDEALDLLRASLPSTVEIVTEIAPELPPLLGDAMRVHQVMMNLGTNAMHAMSERGGILEVKLLALNIDADAVQTHVDLHEGRYLQLTVSDNGVGMSPQAMKRIFEPFFTTKGPGEGTGLGLATVYGIVKDHDGAISVSSRPGEGTTFNIYFPVHEGVAPESAIQSSESPPGRGQHVLFVDDEAPLVLLGKERLERLGYKVTTHTNSVEALKAFHACPSRFDLVITDYIMPDMNGADLAIDMLKVRPGIPVIMLTGYSSTINPEKTTAIGIRELLIKPTTADTIGQAVHRALTKKKEE